MLFQFILLKLILYLLLKWQKYENEQKEAGIGPYFKLLRDTRLAQIYALHIISMTNTEELLVLHKVLASWQMQELQLCKIDPAGATIFSVSDNFLWGSFSFTSKFMRQFLAQFSRRIFQLEEKELFNLLFPGSKISTFGESSVKGRIPIESSIRGFTEAQLLNKLAR